MFVVQQCNSVAHGFFSSCLTTMEVYGTEEKLGCSSCK